MKKFFSKHEAKLFLLTASLMICFIGGFNKNTITLLFASIFTPLFEEIFENLYLVLIGISLMFCISGTHSIGMILTTTLTCVLTAIVHHNNNIKNELPTDNNI